MITARYLLVTGEFCLRYKCTTRTVGSQPDGDSVRFRPDKPSRFDEVPRVGGKAEFNTAGTVQLRFEAVDALETHYDFKLRTHQCWDLGLAARDFMLKQLGFDSVEYSEANGITVKCAEPDPLRGYLMVAEIESCKRPVAFAFGGKPPAKDGTWFEPAVGWLRKSVNCKLAAAGLVYPAYYSTLPYVLRKHFDGLYKKARAHPKAPSLWQKGVDRTRSGVPAGTVASVQKYAAWPKLFRRIVDYYSDTDSKGIGGFLKWLEGVDKRGKPIDDEAWVIGETRKVWLREIMTVKGGKVALTVPPERLIVEPS